MRSRFEFFTAPAVLVGLLVVCAGCPRSPSNSPATVPNSKSADARVDVAATNYPLVYFAEQIGGEYVDVQFPSAGDGDPAFWNPTPAGIAQLQAAEVVAINGANYEKWLAQVTLPEDRIVDTSAAVKDQYIEIQNATTHSHGPEGEHSHTGTAFTTWVDFELAAEQAAAIRDALIKARPDRAETFNQNLEALQGQLRQLDADLKAAAASLAGQPLIVSHPVYQYWARRYQLETHAVHWEPDQVPDQQAIDELKTILAEHPAKYMIWEDTPAEDVAQVVRDLGLQIVVFSPCGNRPEQGDWLQQMRTSVANMQQLAVGATGE